MHIAMDLIKQAAWRLARLQDTTGIHAPSLTRPREFTTAAWPRGQGLLLAF